jgi:3-methyladenine DNA glycosylase AlkD
MEQQELEVALAQNADATYRDFTARLNPSAHRIIGVRVPSVRAIAKTIRDPHTFLDAFPSFCDPAYEEVLIAFILTGKLKDPQETILRLEALLPFNDGWGTNDTLCQGLTLMKTHPDAFWSYLVKKSKSQNPWDVRFSVVSMMDWYLDDAHIDRILDIVCDIDREPTYTMLAAAWLLATAMIRYPSKVLILLNNDCLDVPTQKKAIQKALESRRIQDELKQTLRMMRQAPGERSLPTSHPVPSR